MGRRDGVFGVGLALAPAALAVGTIHLDHSDLLVVQVPREAGAVAPGALDTHQVDRPEALQPQGEPAVADCGGLEALGAEQAPVLVEGGRHVDVEVRVDTSGDASCKIAHVIPSHSR